MSMTEIWQLVHDCYGEELGLTSDDEDTSRPLPTPVATEEKLSTRLSLDSFSEVYINYLNNILIVIIFFSIFV